MGKSLWCQLKSDFGNYLLTLQIKFKAESSLRLSFVLQIAVIIVNNFAYLIPWILFFVQFDSINGWATDEFLALQGINFLILGVVYLSSSGFVYLSEYVNQGSFDGFLLKPTSVVLQLAASRINIPAVGDIISALIILIWYGIRHSPSGLCIILFSVALVVGITLLWSIVFVSGLLSFYVFKPEQYYRHTMGLFLDISMYPGGIISGPMRNILLFIFPALFIGSVQVDVLRGVNLWLVGAGILLAFGWLTFSLWFFRHSVKRYESANLIGAR